jgi:pimeloyl-ACP methyl ester carboxylesterase
VTVSPAETDVRLRDGRTLHVYDVGPADATPLIWHHGTPNIGAPPTPLFADATRLGLRWVSYDRPGYGGSTPNPGRDIASAAADVAAMADALGLDRFAVIGHSGGGAHALACAALLPARVRAAVSVSGLAPYAADGLDWYAGMADSGVASLRAAAEGREAKERFEAAGDAGEPGFTPGDDSALSGRWSWCIDVVRPAIAAGPAAPIDDDLAAVAPWGFDPARITAPTLLLHGTADRMVPSSHSEWLAGRIPSAELRLRPGDGHITVLDAVPDALEWIARQTRA